MRSIKIFICANLLLFYFLGCAGEKDNVKINYRELDEKALKIMKIAEDHYNKKNYFRARRNYKKVVNEYPKSNYADDAQFNIAKIFYERESYMRAIEEYEKLIDDFPASEKIPEAAQNLYSIGEIYWGKGKRYDAVETFKKAVESYPFGKFAPDIQFRIANYYFEEKEYQDAITHFEKLLRLYPDHPAKSLSEYKLALSYFEASLHWALDQDNLNKTISQFNKIIMQNPDGPYTYDAKKKIEVCKDRLAKRQFMIAENYFKDDKYEAADIYYKTVLVNYPETIWASYAQFGMAEILRKNNEWDKAIKAYRKLIADYPESDLEEKALKRIDEMNRMIAKEGNEK
ncbi:outer membrane protein assembly factor BamD [Candidatus Desantisbacteria bacterium]|nr:outer membrane protein assembly factor BamD [Candidatus Desantisbacteria bacterium]